MTKHAMDGWMDGKSTMNMNSDGFGVFSFCTHTKNDVDDVIRMVLLQY